jgi:hypothetical protein
LDDKVLVVKPKNLVMSKPFMQMVPPLFTANFGRQNRGPLNLAEGIPLVDPDFIAFLQNGPPAEAIVVLLSLCCPLFSVASPLTPIEYLDVDLVSLIGTQIELRFLNRSNHHSFCVFQSRPSQFGLRVVNTLSLGPATKLRQKGRNNLYRIVFLQF